VLVSGLICTLTYAVIDPSLFASPLALSLPVICPLLTAPPVIHHLLKTRWEMASATATAEAHTRRLEAMIAERDQLLDVVGHDLAGHVGMIASFATALGQPKVTNNDRLGQAGEIERAAMAIHEVLRDLMAWDRLTIADENTRRLPIDGRKLIDKVVELTRGLAAAKGIFMEGIGRSVHVSVESHQIEGALRNLVGNAIRHTPRDGTIVVSIEALKEDGIAFVVRDNGSGIPADVLAAVRRGEALKPFKHGGGTSEFGEEDSAPRPSDVARAVRGKSNRTGAPRSTGLGLALCREVAERHGGSLEINSSPGAGTTVALKISA
jgi:signal transduction histidine kinase